ncbi:MAG TPA: hypothetical protein VGS57_02250 [Thermoanaerobaculia bacterium]|nr:hypothetical protein [Thermoanaerobaculia bacterium]
MDQKLVVAALAAVAFFWAVQRWRQGTQAVMVLLVVEGAIRKWMFPQSQQLVYFAKDVLLLGCYAGYVRSQAMRRYRVAVPPWLVLLVTLACSWGALEIFNPQLPNALVGILGFKAYFFYVPLIVVLPACFDNDQQLNLFLRRYCLLAVPVAALGMVQFMSGPTSVINAYATGGGDEAQIVTFGSSEHVRVTGTFAFITGYTSYLLATATLLLAVLGASGWKFLANRKLYIALALCLVGMLMTGSRGPIFTLALMFPFYWYLAVMREGDAGVTLSRAGLALGVVVACVVGFSGNAVAAFVGRASGTSDMATRIVAPFLSPLQIMPEAGFLGFGIGASHQMAQAVAPSIIPYSWLHGLNTEVESGRIMLELGPLGFTLVYLMRLTLVAVAYAYARSLRTRFHRALAIGAFLYFLVQLVGSPVFDVTSGVYYWFFAGLMMLAVRLDRAAVRAPVAAAAPLRAAVQPPLPRRERPASPLPGWS